MLENVASHSSIPTRSLRLGYRDRNSSMPDKENRGPKGDGAGPAQDLHAVVPEHISREAAAFGYVAAEEEFMEDEGGHSLRKSLSK